jgi:hypothetical protein
MDGRMMTAANAMHRHRVASSVLLAGGVILVFAGLSAALGFSLAGLIASAAAIAALLYAGGVWFGAPARADATLVLFTPALAVANGPLAGRALGELFPDRMRSELDAHCRAAFAGLPSSFTCGTGSDRVSFSVTPVRDAAGAVTYGLLLSGALATAADAARV